MMARETSVFFFQGWAPPLPRQDGAPALVRTTLTDDSCAILGHVFLLKLKSHLSCDEVENIVETHTWYLVRTRYLFASCVCDIVSYVLKINSH